MMNKKWIFNISILLNVLFIVVFVFNYFNSPTYELGRLKKDLKISYFSSDSTFFYLPKGLTVRNVSQRGIAAISQFENERFAIVITSDNDLVDYDVSKDSLSPVGNFYSADNYKYEQKSIDDDTVHSLK
ncbi:hypothetical protein [Paenimyroides baculatum]|uniref:Uncharacterized protein n=1 Tax=Paenimyroides baculatum TaxID=2608000 RepID=A0A5M6CHB7_9FLAO|nr:hypothetical protein [Paenimyroides baculatum]KAA5534373.1 hypothetical protein F0460_09705 [Paenimyroides baculatum]